MDREIFKIKVAIEEIIKEHNEVWKDISAHFKNYTYPKGYHCFNLKEENVITIAAGLVRKGINYK